MYMCVLTHQVFGEPGCVRDFLQDFHVDTSSLRQHRLQEPIVNLDLDFKAFEKIALRLNSELPDAVKN